MSRPIATAFKASIAVFFCYFPLGMIFGALFVEQGHSWVLAPLYSLFVFAGAIQFLALTFVATSGSLLMLALAIIPISLRNIFYGLSMVERYRNIHPLLRFYLAIGLVDATYSLITLGPKFEPKDDARYITAMTIINHAYWVIGTLFGAFLGTMIDLPKGLEFSLAAFFMATSVEQYMKSRDLIPVFIGAGAIVFALLFFGKNFFLAAVGFAMIISLLIPVRERQTA
jgi:4-azaleucine resistance transporter AzlC